MASSKPMLGDIELQQVQKIEIGDDQVVAQQGIPALEGDFLQRLGRRASLISLTGVLTGSEAGAGLKTLQEKFRAAEPVSFVADIATATKVGQVLIEELGIRELAGKPERFEYALTLREFAPPPAAQQEPPPPPPPPPPSVDTGILIVDVTVTGQPNFDMSKVTVSVEGTQDDGTSLSRTLTQRSGNTWTDDHMPPGQYTVTARVTDPQNMSGSTSATIQTGQTTHVSITLTPASNIAKTFIVHYRFDKAFIEPCMRTVLKQVADYAKAHSTEKLLTVGHTDLVGSDSYNQSLSERRARGVYAYLTFGDPDSKIKDAALADWNALRAKRPPGEDPTIKDNWDVREYQHILQDLGFYPGNVDGQDGPLTRNAVRAYRCQKGLPPGTTVDDQTWEALIKDYLSQDPLSIPQGQFFTNCGSEPLKWLGCGEKDPVKNTPSAWRPNRRTELLFVQASQLPCKVPKPVTFDLPTPGAVNSDWCLGDASAQRTCFVTPAKDPCTSGTANAWCRQPAEPGTITVTGSIKREQPDGSLVPAANQKFVLIASNGQFKASEQSSGDPQPDRTDTNGSFTYSGMFLGIYTLEVRGPLLIRLAEEKATNSKGNSVCKHLGADTDHLDVVIINAATQRQITLPVAAHLMTALHPLTREIRTCPSAGGGPPKPQATAHTDDEIRTAFASANDIWQQARINFNLTDIVHEAYAFRTDCEIDDSEFTILLERCAYPNAVNVFFVGDLAGTSEAGATISPENGAALGIAGCAIGDRFQATVIGLPIDMSLDAQQTAQVLAHELGHYVNLDHADETAANANRLMLPGTQDGSNHTLTPDEVAQARASQAASDNCVSLSLQVKGATQVGGTLSNKYIIIQNAASTVTVDAIIPASLLDPSRGSLTMTGGDPGANNLQRVVKADTKGIVQVVATYTPAGGGDAVTARAEIRVVTFSLSVDGATRTGDAGSTTFVAPIDTNQVVTVKAVIDPEPFSIPSNLITWTGGNAVADPLRRTVSRTNVASTTISAKIAGTTQSVTIVMTVSTVEIILELQDATGTTLTALEDAWVYWSDAGHLNVLRTDNTGLVFDLRDGANRIQFWEYTKRFTTTPGTNVSLYYSDGVTPIPDEILNEHPDVFTQVTIPPPLTGEGSFTQNDVFTLIKPPPIPTSAIFVSKQPTQLTKPTELSIWPLLWELPTDAYHLDGLDQGAVMWRAESKKNKKIRPRPVSTNLSLTENSLAPAPSAAVRPRERGLKVEGLIDVRATGVKLQILNSAGVVVQLRTGIASTSSVQEITGTLGATAPGNLRNFEAVVFFADAVNTFGPVQIIVTSTGMTPPIIGAFSVHLCGLQIALVDDHSQNQNGTVPGAILGEGDEQIIIDFLHSPQPAPAPPSKLPGPISDETRARRMIAHQFANHSRLFDPANPLGPNNPNVLKPQMPMWMAELQFVGLSPAQLATLMTLQFRHQHGTTMGPPVELRADLQWQIDLSWDGPDSNSPAFSPPAVQGFPRPNQTYQFKQSFLGTQVAQLHFGQQGQFTDATGQNVTVGAQGEVPDALVPAPTQISDASGPFPVSGRRLPQVIASNQTRPWGRQANAVQKETLRIEFQPRIVDPTSNREIIRGGDGALKLQNLSINGQPIDMGLIEGTNGVLTPPPAGDPSCRLPLFRVRGLNPSPHASVQTLIEVIVAEFFNSTNQPRVRLLSLRCWQTTAQLIFQHENGGDHQFATNSARARFTQPRNTPLTPLFLGYGLEGDMPLFGPPHGYGFGQLDLIAGGTRGANDDEVWSFVENIRTAVETIMNEKATAAFNLFTQGTGIPAADRPAAIAAFNALTTSDPQRRRAMFQREIVRRYNGGREFGFEGGSWVIHTNVAAARRNYPNTVLHTSPPVVYPGPTPFAQSQFGPDT